jgi:hypothetical protein
MGFQKAVVRFRDERPHRIWLSIKTRCFNGNHHTYTEYGGRGITMCEAWKNDYKAFRTWALENGYGNELSLDRIDNSGNYDPTNCRWADNFTQSRNKRNNVLLTFNGKTMVVNDWVKETGLQRKTISRRLERGWAIEETLTTPAVVGANQKLRSEKNGDISNSK